MSPAWERANESRRAKLKAIWAERKAGAPIDHPVEVLRKPFIPAVAVYTPDRIFLGRTLIALSQGPLTAEGLSAAMGCTVAELHERAGVLKGFVEAIQVAGTYVLCLYAESSAAVRELVGALETLAPANQREAA